MARAAKEDTLPPKPQRYVTDRAGVFPGGRAEALNAKLEQFERETSNQLLVWVDRRIPENFSLEEFTVLAKRIRKQGQVLAAFVCQHYATFEAPDDADRWCDLGESLQRAGRISEARACFARAQTLGPRIPSIGPL